MNISIKKFKNYLFGLLVISFNFGTYFTIAGRALSQCIAFIVMLFSIDDFIGVFHGYKKLEKEKRLILLMILFWFFISIIQILWVGDLTSWKLGMRILLINLFICFEMCVLLKDNQAYNILLRSVEISLWISIAVGLCEAFFDIHFDSDPSKIALGNPVRGFLVNSNDFATWCVLCLLGTTLYYSRKKRKFMCYIEWILATYVIKHTASRSGIISVIIAAGFIVIGNILKLGEETKSGLPQKRKAFHVLGIVSLIVVGGIALLGGDVAAIINKVSSAAASDTFRLRIIEDSLKVAFKYVLIGAGAQQTTFYVEINPHNFLLELLADYGILIAGIMVFILWKIFIRIFDSKKITGYEIACYAFVPTFLMISIASSSMNRLRMMWVVLLLYYFVSSEQLEACNYRKCVTGLRIKCTGLKEVRLK